MTLVAAASFNGAYDKWRFRDGEKRYGVELMLAGEADRPFAYRTLNPWIVGTVADHTPEALKARAKEMAFTYSGKSKIGPSHLVDADPDAFWRYTLLYYLTFAEWLGAILLMAAVASHFAGPGAGTAAAAVLALIFPVFLSEGGYFYDFPEVLFFAAAAYAAIRGWIPLLAGAALIGVVNKETMVFFLPTLFVFLKEQTGARKALMTLGALTLASAALYLLIRSHYAGNPGSTAEFNFLANLAWYADLRHLFEVEKTYGLLLFRAYSAVGIGFVVLLAVAGWRTATRPVRRHALFVLLLNAPLFIALGYHGEMRGLSLTYVAWTILAACAIRAWMSRHETAHPKITV
ncbi:MAG: hypothetical protein ACOY5Y_12270 [Pseudomonadota bacterium]